MRLLFDGLNTDIGAITVVCNDEHLLALEFEGLRKRMEENLAARFGDFRSVPAIDPLGVVSRLDAYFNGDYAAVEDIDVDPGGTEFQQRVWRALRTIPAGETVSYGQLASRIGQPTASRAVGLANARNPVGIVLPCHRVIGADGSLTGYAGGIDRKRWLLSHEQVSGQLSLLA
jgi:methylated-DNA-[protein]-cysteine S-methyltransferase